MKKIYTTVIAACMAAGAMAQVQVGPKLGMNLSKINDGEKVEEGTSEPFAVGFNLGVATSFEITENFSFAPELIFTQKGSRLTAEGTDQFFDGVADVEMEFSYSEKIKLNYLEMPVLARVAFGNTVKGYVNAGPSLGYWLGGKTVYEEEFNGESDSDEYKIKFVSEYDEDSDDAEILKDEANRLEVGALVGGGLMLNTGAGDILLDVRYQAGLTNMIDFDEDDEQFKNNSLSFSVIYLLGSR